MQEGAGHAVLSAFVEIVFDNSDNRLPVSLLLVLGSPYDLHGQRYASALSDT